MNFSIKAPLLEITTLVSVFLIGLWTFNIQKIVLVIDIFHLPLEVFVLPAEKQLNSNIVSSFQTTNQLLRFLTRYYFPPNGSWSFPSLRMLPASPGVKLNAFRTHSLSFLFPQVPRKDLPRLNYRHTLGIWCSTY